MIWLTWRQFRLQVSVIFAAVASLAITMAVTGPGLLRAYHADAIGFLNQIANDGVDKTLYLVGLALMYASPPVIGAFWGAPLIARELEAGTHRLVWNQSTTRNRWLAIKLGLTGLAAMLATGLLSLAVSWWSSPIDQAVASGHSAGPFSFPRLFPIVYGARGVVPIGYTAFAFALGVALGLILRRSVPAIAITLAAVIAVQIAMPLAVRGHLIAPVQLTTTITTSNFAGLHGNGPPDRGGTLQAFTINAGKPGDWLLTNQTIDSRGAVPHALPAWIADCFLPQQGVIQQGGTTRQKAPGPQILGGCFTRVADAGFRQRVTYQPATRFWALQWRETAVFLTLAVLLTGFCFWRVRRDLS
jgi:ABC-type transport system involved in multi-copper enzyme maturation permease subunit